MTPNWKPSGAKRKLATMRKRRERKTGENKNKGEVRRRDGHRCRFPLCGCRTWQLRLEVSHNRHKGMGGDPKGDRSKPEGMILVCFQRHQDGVVSFHKGTLEARPLTADGMNGPVAWWVDCSAIAGRNEIIGGWHELARETSVQKLEPLVSWQRAILERLSLMDV
jgi:hypothetical protein